MQVWELIALDAEQGARALIREYGDHLYATAFRLCLNESDAEDLVQRTLVNVVTHISSFSGKSSFFTWMCAILVNFRRMDLRKKGANALVFDEQEVESEDSSPTPADRAEREDEAALMRKAVSKLPEDLRTVVVLHYFNGMSVQAIAKALPAPEGTVYSRLHDARKKIRKIFQRLSTFDASKLVKGLKT